MRVRNERFTWSGTIGLGILGIYNPGDSSELPLGAPRVVYQENEEHFTTVEEMERFLIEGSAVYTRVCTEDGLVFGFSLDGHRNAIGIDVWQLYVNGNKPKLSQESKCYSIGVEVQRNLQR